jgi:hypothetical protein
VSAADTRLLFDCLASPERGTAPAMFAAIVTFPASLAKALIARAEAWLISSAINS